MGVSPLASSARRARPMRINAAPTRPPIRVDVSALAAIAVARLAPMSLLMRSMTLSNSAL